MASNSQYSYNRNFRSNRIDLGQYWLVPKNESSDGFPIQGQSGTPELLRIDHEDVRDYPDYEYSRLPQDKKRIRLMKLSSGEVWGSKIYCKLIEAEYDEKFHIPTEIRESGTDNKEVGGGGKGKTRDSAADDPESDLEQREKVKRERDREETPDERLLRIQRQQKREIENRVKVMKSSEGKKEKDDEELNKRVKEWEAVMDNQVEYEALSWSWGDADEVYALLIKVGDETYKKPVRKALALALKYLRRPDRERTLWIDAICINQKNPGERNHQVQMMSRVYTRAKQVCVWLGEADSDSDMAIKFIKEEIKELKNFDKISSSELYSQKWQALMSLMQRGWFFRRWVVQEIALAGAATVYCGPHSVPWKSFAVAVELFVEVETATHRLSEVMKRDEKFRHVPNYFEHVSELGASLLVQATGKVFRVQRSPMQPEPDSSDEEGGKPKKKLNDRERKEKKERKEARNKKEKDLIRARLRETQTIDPLERRSLLSLEFLVSTMFIFQASEPRDVVYALLAIARDAAPFAPAQYGQDDQKLHLVMTLLDRFLAEKPFTVDYNKPYSDVCRDFVEFSIKRTHKADPQQALDILCRPWALEPPKEKSSRVQQKSENKKKQDDDEKRLIPKRREWKTRPDRRVERHPGEKETNNPEDYYFVNKRGSLDKEKWHLARYRYIEDANQDTNAKSWLPDGSRDNKTYAKDNDAKKAWSVWEKDCKWDDCEHGPDAQCTRKTWKPSPGWQRIKDRYFPDEGIPDMERLPTWVARATQAPFMLDHAPGMELRKTSRANADPLVGSPQDGHRNYNAAGSEGLDLNTLKFKKRPRLGHYSLFVEGFQLDKVVDVADASQLGGIPRSWLKLVGWNDLDRDPPDEFWRTIVADRGRDNRNPPYYYARACKESVHKGGTMGGTVNTMALINNEQNSIVAEFCRRVQAVIWNRCLFKTKDGRLGLAHNVKKNDEVFIMKGCTVPVILRRVTKGTMEGQNASPDSPEVIKAIEVAQTEEEEEDRVELLKSLISKAISRRERKYKYKPKIKMWKKEKGGETWRAMMDARQQHKEIMAAEKLERDAKAEPDILGRAAKKNYQTFIDDWAKEVREADVLVETAKEALAADPAAANGVEDEEFSRLQAEVETAEARKAEVIRRLDAELKRRVEAGEAVEQEEGKVASPRVEAKDDDASDSGAQDLPLSQDDKDPGSSPPKPAKPEGADAATTTREAGGSSASDGQGQGQDKGKGKMVEEAAVETPAPPAAPPAPPEMSPTSSGTNTTGTPMTTDGGKEADDERKRKEKEWKKFWHEFKGECYLHGMMDGEAMRKKFYDELEYQILELR